MRKVRGARREPECGVVALPDPGDPEDERRNRSAGPARRQAALRPALSRRLGPLARETTLASTRQLARRLLAERNDQVLQEKNLREAVAVLDVRAESSSESASQ
jgi:hypothetical protein